MRLAVPVRRTQTRTVVLDRSLESLPVFRLSDSADEGAITYVPDEGRRWRVLPAPGDRLPGTFDQDVYVEILHRYNDAGRPGDGVVRFTLHAFLRSIGRRVDGRTYEQLRCALARLERTTLESSGVYITGEDGAGFHGTFTLLSSVTIERRRLTDRDQFALFNSLSVSEPGDARVVIAPQIRANIATGRTSTIFTQQYTSLSSPVARRLYRLLEVARAEGTLVWQTGLETLAAQLPLTQRYPSHLQRVLQPAHEMLLAAGVVTDVKIGQANAREWQVVYVLGARSSENRGQDTKMSDPRNHRAS
jgi:plasmid replication initiation protein